MVKRLWEWAIVQAESMSETGLVTGLLAAPLLGVVTEEDADSAVVIDMARNVLGNPYEDEVVGGAQDRRRRCDLLGRGAVRTASGGGSLGVTGVDHVGGGPVGDEGNGDQKSGRGADGSSPTTPSDGGRPGGRGPRDGGRGGRDRGRADRPG